MTYRERFKAPKFGEKADATAIIDTGDPYQNLANGVVAQAAADYMAAIRLIGLKPDAPKLEEYLKPEQLDILREPIKRTEYEKLKLRRLKKQYRDEQYWETCYRVWWTTERHRRVRMTPEYRAYANAEKTWVDAHDMIEECEEFFHGDWIKMLTKLDGPELMRRCRKIAEEDLNELRC